MYIDKDANGDFSIAAIRQDELQELNAILLEFEFLIKYSNSLSDRQKATMLLLSAKIRFGIIDALK